VASGTRSFGASVAPSPAIAMPVGRSGNATKPASVWPPCVPNDASPGIDRESITSPIYPVSVVLAHTHCPAAPAQGVDPLGPVSAAAAMCQLLGA